jgi:hypothetical protein
MAKRKKLFIFFKWGKCEKKDSNCFIMPNVFPKAKKGKRAKKTTTNDQKVKSKKKKTFFTDQDAIQ